MWVVGWRLTLGALARPLWAVCPWARSTPCKRGLAGQVHAFVGQHGHDARRWHSTKARLVGHAQQLGALINAQRMAGCRTLCYRPAISLGQPLMRLPALQGARVYAGYVADLLQACSCISGNLNVLGQTAAICDEDHASSPQL